MSIGGTVNHGPVKKSRYVGSVPHLRAVRQEGGALSRVSACFTLLAIF